MEHLPLLHRNCKIVEADSKLMLLPKVMKAVSERLSDESISVREAVVSLVGNYVVASPRIANAFHIHLIPRLLDPGVSVRKRTVRILQDILCTNPSYRGRSDACDKCLQRAADPKEDDGVREALHTLFMKLWLEDGDDAIPAGLKSSSPARNRLPQSPGNVEPMASGVVTPTPPMTDARATRSMHREVGKQRSELAAEQMVATVKTAGTNEHLGNFLRELLCNVNDSDKGKKAAERLNRQKIAEKQVFSLVDALFELLLSTEERRAELGNALGEELAATIRTIGCFAEGMCWL
jgi:cohesin loading factor subunit SCC2